MPEYSCSGCAAKYSEEKELPDCLNGTGCLIGESIARDPYVNRLVQNYILAHNMPSAERSSQVFESLLGELIHHPDLLAEMDGTLVGHRNAQQEQAQQRAKHQSLIRSR